MDGWKKERRERRTEKGVMEKVTEEEGGKMRGVKNRMTEGGSKGGS